MTSKSDALKTRLAECLGEPVQRLEPLHGGCIAEVYRVYLAASSCVAKVGSSLTVEAIMLCYLKEVSALPVPEVIYSSDDLLLLDHLEHDGGISQEAEAHAGELLAALHEICQPDFGFHRDTLIGPLPQDNTPSRSWPEFFRERRLLPMARSAHEAGQVDSQLLGRLEALAERLEDYLDVPATPALVHGDIWQGNVLAKGGRIAGFLDPALYYADPEVELAYISLFHTFGPSFFDAYRAHRPIQPGFFERRKDIYNLYPLLVHARLFGGSYPGTIRATLKRLA